MVQRRRQPKVEENHDVNDDDRDEEEERVSGQDKNKMNDDICQNIKQKLKSSLIALLVICFSAPRC